MAKLIPAPKQSIASLCKAAFKKNRYIIPASGYYEWQYMDGKKKPQP